MDYKYEPLPDTTSIRLLRPMLRPVPKHPSVRGLYFNLSIHPLKDLPSFNALSYTWGEPVDDPDDQWAWNMSIRRIEINGKSLRVQENLYRALYRLGVLKTNEYIWIDAICINQEDKTERSEQVLLMCEIYSTAKEVIVWLGDDPNSVRQLNAIPTLWNAVTRELPRKYELSQDDLWKHMAQSDPQNPETAMDCGIRSFDRWKELWTDYFRFFETIRWFHRAWIIQEVALAQHIIFWCDKMSLEWREMGGFVLKLRKAGWLEKLRPETVDRNVGDEIFRIYTFRELSPGFKDESSKDMALSVYGAVTEKERWYAYFAHVICRFRPAKASNPIDKIYSALGLVEKSKPRDLINPVVTPSYNLPVEDVYTKATSSILENSPFLSILSFLEDSDLRHLSELPSWVPDYSIAPRARSLLNIGAFKSTDDDLDSADPIESWRSVRCGGLFNASLAVPGQDCPVRKIPICNGELYLQGFLFDTIEEALLYKEADYKSFILPLLEFCSRLSITNPKTGQTRKETLWRTMIADTWRWHPAPTYVQDWYHEFTKFVITLRIREDAIEAAQGASENLLRSLDYLDKIPLDLLPTKDGEIEMFPHMDNPEGMEIDDNFRVMAQKVQDYMYGMDNILKGRQLYRTALGYLGFGPSNSRIGDEVWLLKGAQVPFILRSRENKKFSLVGETYLHGFMHGEMLTPELNAGLTDVCII